MIQPVKDSQTNSESAAPITNTTSSNNKMLTLEKRSSTFSFETSTNQEEELAKEPNDLSVKFNSKSKPMAPKIKSPATIGVSSGVEALKKMKDSSTKPNDYFSPIQIGKLKPQAPVNTTASRPGSTTDQKPKEKEIDLSSRCLYIK